jgi:hypothetical protein
MRQTAFDDSFDLSIELPCKFYHSSSIITDELSLSTLEDIRTQWFLSTDPITNIVTVKKTDESGVETGVSREEIEQCQVFISYNHLFNKQLPVNELLHHDVDHIGDEFSNECIHLLKYQVNSNTTFDIEHKDTLSVTDILRYFLIWKLLDGNGGDVITASDVNEIIDPNNTFNDVFSPAFLTQLRTAVQGFLNDTFFVNDGEINEVTASTEGEKVDKYFFLDKVLRLHVDLTVAPQYNALTINADPADTDANLPGATGEINAKLADADTDDDIHVELVLVFEPLQADSPYTDLSDRNSNTLLHGGMTSNHSAGGAAGAGGSGV